jgi:DNA-3-methyladenine glycosylase I
VPDLVVGSNGLTRCGWGGSPEDNRAYHDEEWGRPVHGDVPLFERLVLESFQSGLSWLTILRKRAAFRAAFAGFDIDTVSEFRAADVDRLLGNVGIVRNRAKINATVTNARAARGLVAAEGPGALDRLVWSAGHSGWSRPTSFTDFPTSTAESKALAARFKQEGFTFLGPVTVFAALCAVGVVDAHLVGCFRA